MTAERMAYTRLLKDNSEWAKASASTCTGTYAIVDPAMLHALAFEWDRYLLDGESMRESPLDKRWLDQWRLEGEIRNHSHGTTYDEIQDAVLFTVEDNANCQVEVRYSDYYRSGHQTPVEVRLRLRPHDHYDDNCGDPECCPEDPLG